MEIFEMIVSIVLGLGTLLTLIYELIKYVRMAIKERNWTSLVSDITTHMIEAERKYDNGADRKAYVMQLVEASANLVRYNIDMDVVSDLIDRLCAMSKMVNPPDAESGGAA